MKKNEIFGIDDWSAVVSNLLKIDHDYVDLAKKFCPEGLKAFTKLIMLLGTRDDRNPMILIFELTGQAPDHPDLLDLTQFANDCKEMLGGTETEHSEGDRSDLGGEEGDCFPEPFERYEDVKWVDV